MKGFSSGSVIFGIVLVSLFNHIAVAEPIAINDAHLHYDEDVWASLSPEQAIEMLRKENIKRALISATPAEGAEKIYQADPQLVIPMLRPYKSWRHRYYWFKDPDLKAFLTEHLSRIPYRGLGEFHIFGEDVETSVVDEMIELARMRKLALQPHTDLVGIRLLLKKASDLVIIWAHAGFNVSVDTLKELLDRYPHFYIELSLREGMLDDNDYLTAEWKSFLIKYRQRILVGADTYKPSRWADLPELMEDTRAWLRQLPADVATDIARNNINRLFPD